MKLSVISSLTCALALVACAKTGNTPQTPTGQAKPVSQEGGVNGGGGGTLPAEPISHYDVVRIIRDAKTELSLYIKHEQLYDYRTDKLRKFFTGSPNLWDVLQTVDLEVLEDKPCKDGEGLETDASVHASRPNTICLSSFRVAPKLIKERAEIEILALLVHELSHFLGADEVSEAQALQKWAAHHFSRHFPGETYTTAEQFIEKLADQSESLVTEFYRIEDKFDKATEHELAEKVSHLYTKFEQLYFASRDTRYSALNKHEADFMRVQLMRLRMGEAYQDMLDTEREIKRDWSKFLEKVFAGHDEVTYQQACERSPCYDHSPNHFATEKIRRIRNRTELKALVLSLHEYVRRTDSILRQLRWGSRPNRPLLPNAQPTPWLKFIGDYTVDSENCDSAKRKSGTSRFEVTYPEWAKNELRLVRHTSSGWGDHGGLTDGSMVINAGASVFVNGTDTWVERVDVFGDLWSEHGGQHFTEHSLKLESLGGDKFKMTERYHWRDHVYTKFTDEFATCTFMLTKKN